MGTLERLLAGMCPDVTLKEPRSRERLATYLTLAGQRVRPDVHLEGAHRRVGLVAVLTRKLLPDPSGTVELFVLGDSAQGRIALGASVAFVPRRVSVFTDLIFPNVIRNFLDTACFGRIK